VEIVGFVLDRTQSFLAENWLAIAVIVVAARLVRFGMPLRASRVLRVFAWSETIGAIVAAALSLAASLIVFAFRGEPLPVSYDDLSHLLLADTLLHGRLANPAHPFGRYLETVVFHAPRYASQYPPGNGFALALGGLLVHLPIAGIWLVSAAAAAAAVWAMRPWLSRSWCVLAGCIVALHPTITLWNTVYFGGSVPLLGGILLLGATGRLLRRPRVRDASIAAIGIVILANSRQYEGLLMALAMVPLVLIAKPRRVRAIVAVSPAAIAILAAGIVFIGVFNRAVTGSALVLPHALYDRTHNPAPNFIWQTKMITQSWDSEEFEWASRPYISHHLRLHAPGGVSHLIGDKLTVMLLAITAPEATAPVLPAGRLLLLLPLLAIISVRGKREVIALLVALSVFLVAPLTTSWWLSRHYLAPGAVLVLLIYLLLARRALAYARGAGGWMLIASLIVFAGLSAGFVATTSHRPQTPIQVDRRQVMQRLERMGGEHLVLVPPSIYFVVFNGADLEHAPVLWAREPGGSDKSAMLRHYARRRIWRAVSQNGHLTVVPLPHA
jgi:hypothetical protein